MPQSLTDLRGPLQATWSNLQTAALPPGYGADIPAVLIATFFIKSLPLTVLNWLVFAVVLYTSTTLLWSAWRTPAAAAAAATVT